MRKIFIVLLVSFLALQLSAQKVGGGLQVGTGYSWLTVNSKEASSEKGRVAFTFGAFGDYNLTDNFSLSLGANLLINGGTVKYNNPIFLEWDDETYNLTPNSEVTYKMQHVEVPISLKGRTQEIGYITYFAKVGGQFSFAHIRRADINHGVAVGSGGVKFEDTEKLNIKKSVNPFNMGWHVGAGIEYSLGGSTAMVAELVFSQSFFSIAKNKITKPNKDIAVKPNFIALKVGIKF